MAEFTQYLVSGLALGAIYGLVALGFVVIYRASQVFNFAHGELLTFGAVFMVWLSSPALNPEDALGLGAISISGLGLPWGVSLILAMAATGFIAAAIEKIALDYAFALKIAKKI